MPAYYKSRGKSFAREGVIPHEHSASTNKAVIFYNESLECMGVGGHAEDDAFAFALNVKAAELHWPDAVLAMGWFYLNGRGVAQDTPRARYWYGRSARAGEPRAMFSLGEIAFRAGDYSDARRWFERASKRGHMRSFYWLGKLAWRGQGITQDRSVAHMFFHRAARAHDPEAVRALRYLSRRSRNA